MTMTTVYTNSVSLRPSNPKSKDMRGVFSVFSDDTEARYVHMSFKSNTSTIVGT